MPESSGRLRFGPFELDLAQRELRRGGQRVDLRPTPLRLLLYLAEHRGRTVSKQELLDTLWHDAIVTDTSLANALNQARLAVEDDGTAQRVIRTLKGHGYRFVAEVSAAVPAVSPGQPPHQLPRSPQISAEQIQRRLAAILSADVEGYSRLMAGDEDATVQLVTAYREEVELLVRQHRGELVDFTGDNFLAEFGSAVAAVECATEIQRVLKARNAPLPDDRKMKFRLGVHLGEVRVEGERLFGTGINVAARIQGLAEPGGLCISGEVHGLVQGKLALDFEDLGAQRVKNIPEPVRVFRVKTEAAPAATPSKATRRAALAAGLALLLGAGAVAGWRLFAGRAEVPTAAAISAPIRSLAVLPLENLSGDPAQDYVADGLTEVLIGELAKIGSLRVISRTSVMQYKGTRKTAPEIAAELDVGGLVEGSAFREGDRIRITLQLIDARADDHIWAQSYERDLRNVMALQSEVALAVVEQIQLELTPEEQVVLTAARPVDEEAYDAYVRGLSHFGPLSNGGVWVPKALEQLERAVALDPDFAEAWSWLSVVRTLVALGERDDFPKARDAAEKALSLDPQLGTAHTALGFVRQYYDWDPDGARAAWERGVQLSPNDPFALFGYYLSVYWRGRFEEALEISDRMLRVAPRELLWRTQRVKMLHGMRFYERAIEEADRVRREFEPAFVDSEERSIYAKLGRFEEAHQAAIAWLTRCGAGCDGLREAEERGWAEDGFEGTLRARVEFLTDPSDRFILGAPEFYADLGKMDRGFEELERAFEAREPFLFDLIVYHPDYDAMRVDPRFDALLKRMNLSGRPELPARLADVGRVLAFRGRPLEAISRLERAMAQSPEDPRLSRWLDSMAWARFASADYEQSASWAERVLARDVSTHAAAFAHLLLASSYAHLDRVDAASAELEEARRLWPSLEIDRDLRPLFLGGNGAMRDRYVEGLRTAGLEG